MSQILTARQLAARLAVTPATIHAWQRRGRIPCLRAGHREVRFEFEAVLAALRQHGKPGSQHSMKGAAE